MFARMNGFMGRISSQINYEVRRFFNLWGKAETYAEEKLWFDYYCRLVSPDSVEEYKDHLELMDYMVETLVIGLPADGIDGWPPETANEFMAELMDTSLKGCTIMVSEKLAPVPNSVAHAMLRNASYNNQSNQKTAIEGNDLHLPDEELKLDLRDINAGIAALHDNQEKMYSGSFIITMWAEDEAAMKRAKSHVNGTLNTYRVSGRYPHHREFDAFIGAQAYPGMLDMSIMPLFSSFAAQISPTINPNTLIGSSETGVYVCDDRHTGRELIVDFEKLPAPHIMMVGSTGSGKTYALLLLLMRLYVDSKRKVIYMTVKPDPKTKYRAVADYFGADGCVVDIGPGKYNINPLQIISDESILKASPVEVAAKYDAHKDVYCTFLKEWFESSYSSNMDSYVDESLDKLYKSKGILRDDAKTWVNASWPLSYELRELWEGEFESLGFKKKQTCEALIEKTSKMRKGGALDYLNRPTNVDWSLGFMIIDLSGVAEVIKEPMNVMLTGMLANQVTANSEKGLTIAIDEGGAFLREKRPAKMILTGLTQWRSQNTQMVFCTQQFSDMKKADLAEEFLTNCHTKVVMGGEIDDSAVPYIQKTLHLNDDAVHDLVTSKKGEGIIKISNVHAAIAFRSTKVEHGIIKGWFTEDPVLDEEEQEIAAPVSANTFEIRDSYKELCKKNHIVFEYMLNPDYSAKALEDAGYKHYSPVRVFDTGTLNCWIEEDILKDVANKKLKEEAEEKAKEEGLDTPEEPTEAQKKHALNQTIDHYSTVVQMASYLGDIGFEKAACHHYGDVDVSAELNGESYGYEYERDRSHTVEQIMEKYKNAKMKYDHVFFICAQNNERKVKSAVGKDNYSTRGFGLKDALDKMAKGEYYEKLQE